MSHSDADENREPQPSGTLSAVVDDAVVMVITQLFCPNGHNLIGRSDERFDEHPGVSLVLSDGETEGEVVLSPIFGDPRKRGVKFAAGTKLKLQCPECRSEFPPVITCQCPKGQLRQLYLTPACSESHIVAVCDTWGCTRSRLIDGVDVLQEFLQDGG